VLYAVRIEREAQDKKWGEQNHPLIIPNPKVLTPPFSTVRGLAAYYDVPAHVDAIARCDQRHKAGYGTWSDILIEELCEFVATGLNSDDDESIKEGIQVAAVAVAAVENAYRVREAR
jgi:hypothetical protein